MRSLPLPDSVLFILLDGFRPDYLDRTRFLRRVAARASRGSLEEPFGFCPRGAYFGGLTMAEQGYTHLYRYDPNRSPFAWTRELTSGEHTARVLDGTRGEILARARMALPPFGAGAVSLLDIPLEWLHYFDFAERHAPWSSQAGYRSLFHACDDAGLPWLEVSWPFADLSSDATDGVVTGLALERLHLDHRFAYLHLPSLDALGHLHGPGGAATHTALQTQDRLCELIVDRACALFDDPVLVFAGDHGMLPVVRTLDVVARLRSTGLRYGHDLVSFVDSTMVRCWFFEARARARAMTALRDLGGGHWLTQAERERWQLAGIDSRNGEEYFLLDPGVVCAPSFFDWSAGPIPRGMHGYAPDVADNHGLLLIHRPRRRGAGDIGVAAARRLYPTFARWLGLDAGSCTADPIDEADEVDAPSRWFVSRPRADDAIIDAQINSAVAAIRSLAPGLSAIVLTGSGGRAEATPEVTGAQVRAANDYDLLVVGADLSAFEGLGARLAASFDIDYVDIDAVESPASRHAATLANFDLRYGSRVIWGDPLTLENLPPLAPADVDGVEAAFLLHNRLGGLLVGLVGPPVADALARGRYTGRQITKLLIAVGDAWLIHLGDYGVSCRRRAERFAALAAPGGFQAATVDRIVAAYATKLLATVPAPSGASDVTAALEAVTEFRRLTYQDDRDLEARLVSAAVQRHLLPTPRWRDHVRAAGLWLRPEPWPAAGGAVYRAVSAVTKAWPCGNNAGAPLGRAALADVLHGLDDIDDAHIPATVAGLWLAFFH